MKPKPSDLVYIVVLNWNGWADTLECLESLFRLEYPCFRIVVCDNGSGDGSLEHVRAWADGRLSLLRGGTAALRNLTWPPVAKPVRYRELLIDDVKTADLVPGALPLTLISNKDNLGFAGGNNVGIRYALTDCDTRYIWLLNNDTVADPAALSRLVARMDEKPEAGICGSTLVFYDRPDAIQALGGATYNHVLGSNRHLGLHQHVDQPIDQAFIERRMDYVIGASMLIRRELLETIGVMDERYFLYFEELDWATRAKKRFDLAFAAGSIVYHKEGASAGTSSRPKSKSLLSDYYSLRNRLVFTKKFYPWALPIVFLGLCMAFLNRIRRGQPDHAKMIARLLLMGANAAPPSSQRAA